MIKILAIFALVFGLNSNTFAQSDSLRNEILNSSESRVEVIEKGRRLILDKFIEGDRKKVQELFNYLIEQEEDEDYLVFYPIEKFLLYYWTEQYQPILEALVNLDSVMATTRKTMIRPREDMLFPKVAGHLMGKRVESKLKIDFTDLNQAEKDILKLNFDYLLADFDQISEVQQDLNMQADQFLAAHPNSMYEAFVRDNIRVRLAPSGWGYAFEFFSGYGIFTGDLESKFKNSIPIGIAFDINYNRFGLYLRNYIGFSKTKNDIPFQSGTWSNNAQARVFLPEASFGYVVLDSKYLKLVPFAGISSTDISPTENDQEKIPEYKDLGLSFTTTYTAGLSLDIKFAKSISTVYANGPEQSYSFARIRYSYNKPQFNKHYTEFNGNFHSITIGVGGFLRAIKRAH